MPGNNYKETFESWNKIARLYQDKFMNLDLYNETYDLVCDFIDKNHAKILDVGCGPGNITKYLLSKRPDFDIHGIDIAPNMIALAENNNPMARFSVMDIRRINDLNDKYDGIVCGFCLPYLSQTDSVKLIKDCSNLLNDHGVMYLSFMEGDPETSGFQTGSTADRVYFYYYDLDHLTEQLLIHGFDKPRVFKVLYQRNENTTEVHTILITKKGSA